MEPGRGGGQCPSYRSLQERREGLEAFQTFLKRRSRRRMMSRRRRMMMMSRRRRGRGEVEDGMLVKFPLVPFATCLRHLHLLLQGSFQQEEVKQPHCRDTQRPNIINYLEPPEAPDHLPLATHPCLPEPCNHCGKNFKHKTACLSTCWWSMEPDVSKKYCKTDIRLSCRHTKRSALSLLHHLQDKDQL